MPDLVTVPNVELVKTGNWPAVTGPAKITEQKLDAMIEASKDPNWSGAPVKVGHTDHRLRHLDGEPALGWVQNLRKVTINGVTTLIGDLVDVPKKFAGLLKSAYKNRSIEWRENDSVAGKKYASVLSGLAVLGATPPGVDGLAAITQLFASAGLPSEGTQTAYVGENGEQIVQALSTLRALMHADDEKVGHDEPQPNAAAPEGGSKVAMTAEEAKAALESASQEDLDAEIERRRAAASGSAPKTTENGDETEKPKETEKTQEGETKPATTEQPKPSEGDGTQTPPASGAAAGSEVTLSRAVFDQLVAKANRGDQAWTALRDDRIDRELKLAARQGKIVMAEFSAYKDEMLKSEENEQLIRGLLAKRPQLIATEAIGSPVEEDNFLGRADDTRVDQSLKALFGDELASVYFANEGASK